MNPEQRLDEVRARLNELQGLDTLSDEQRAEWRTLLDEGRVLAEQISQRADDAATLAAINNVQRGAQLRDMAGRAVVTRSDAPVDQAQVETRDEIPTVLCNYNGVPLADRIQRAVNSYDYQREFALWFRSGGQADAYALRTLQEGLDQAGGYLVPPQYVSEIISPPTRPSGLLGQVRTMPISSLKLQFPRNNWSIDNANDTYNSPYRKLRTGETGAPSTQTAIPFGLVDIDVYEGSIEVPLTRSLLADSSIGIAEYVRSLLDENLAQDTERELAVGTGVNTPAGVTRNPGGAGEPPVVNMGNPVTAGGYFSLHYALPQQYRQNAVYVMNDFDTYRTHAQLVDASNAYIFGVQSRNDGLALDREERVFNRSIVFNPHMASPGANANVVAFGDFRRGYVYAMHTAMTLSLQDLPRDPLVYMVLRFRDGGRFVNPRAVRIGRQA